MHQALQDGKLEAMVWSQKTFDAFDANALKVSNVLWVASSWIAVILKVLQDSIAGWDCTRGE